MEWGDERFGRVNRRWEFDGRNQRLYPVEDAARYGDDPTIGS